MEFTLERLIADIKQEKILWAVESTEDSEKVQETWDKVGSRNKLTGGEAKSIFKVLCKKYKQEAGKPASNWKLFNNLKFLDEKDKPASKDKEQAEPSAPAQQDASIIEEETYVELLEVKDEDFSDDEYSRSFDETKPDVDGNKEKTEKQTETTKASTEVDKKENSSEEKNKDKTAAAPEINLDKKPVVAQINLNAKRKLPDSKDDYSVPEKRSAHILKLVPSKIIQNGVIKNNAETETEPSNQLPIHKRYSNFGQYVESTLNRMSPRLATKLEIKILQSIIEVSNEMMDKFD